MGYLLTVIAVASAWALYVTWLAARLRRLHSRSAAAAQALVLQLTRRALAVSNAVSDHAALLPNSAVTLQLAAHLALHAASDEREAAESDLTRALQEAVRGNPMLSEQREQIFRDVVIQNRRVEMARALYNDAVRDTCALRRRWQLRALRLAAHLERPDYFDIDTTLSLDAPPLDSPSMDAPATPPPSPIVTPTSGPKQW